MIIINRGDAMNWMMRPVLVIGNGPVSDALVKKLLDEYAYVYFWDPFENKRPEYEPIQVIRRNVENIEEDESFLRSPMSVFFTISNGMAEEKIELVQKILERVLKAISDRKTRFVVGLYSMNDYSKNIVENILEIIKTNKREFSTLLYLGDVYGENVRKGVVFYALNQLKKNSSRPKIALNPRERRNHIHIEDAVRSMMMASDRVEEIKAYNVAGTTVENRTIIRKLIRLLGIDGVCKVNFSAGEKEALKINFEKLTWFKPKVKLNEGLKRTIGWFEAEYGPILVCQDHHEE